jgi:hypothetical protein
MLAFALALPVELSPPLVLTYSGRSENQHFLRTVHFCEPGRYSFSMSVAAYFGISDREMPICASW